MQNITLHLHLVCLENDRNLEQMNCYLRKRKVKSDEGYEFVIPFLIRSTTGRRSYANARKVENVTFRIADEDIFLVAKFLQRQKKLLKTYDGLRPKLKRLSR